MTDLLSLVSAQRFTELRALVEGLAVHDALSVRGRAELAAVRMGPPCDSVLAARRALAEGWVDAPRYLGQAVRVAWSVGALPLARELLDAATALPEEHSELLHLRELLESDAGHRARAVGSLAAYRALRAGNVEAATQAFNEAVEQNSSTGDRVDALHMLARLARQRGDFAAACRFHGCAHDAAPAGDRAPAYATGAALDAWLAGDAVGALEGLRAVRAGIGPEQSATSHAARRAETLLQALERTAEASCQWLSSEVAASWVPADDAAGVLAIIARWLKLPPPEVPEGHERLAHVRRLLQLAGVETLRVRATPQVITAAMELGVLLVLEEERPIGHALTLVSGWDPHTSLLAVREPSTWGAEILSWQEQSQSMEMLSHSALLVLGSLEHAQARLAKLAVHGVEHDPLFDTLDACEVDENGEVPPFAEALALAREVIETDPTCQLAHKRGGDALLYGYRVDRVDDDELLAWIASAREHFPQAEWPQQMYAQWLASKGRAGEAAIAWAQARAADPWDYRNPYGEARALVELDLMTEAEPLLRTAATLQGGAPDVTVSLAQAALSRSALELAEACACLGTALAPERGGAWSTRASVLELRDRSDEAIEAFERATGLPGGEDPWLALRLARSYATSGKFELALARLAPLLSDDSEQPPEVVAAVSMVTARLRASLADLTGALDTLTHGLLRCGARSDLLAELARLLDLMAVDAPDFASSWHTSTKSLTSAAEPCSEVLLALSLAGQHELALTSLAHMAEALGSGPNRAWLEARTRLYGGSCDQTTLGLLGTVVEALPGFETPRALLALQLTRTKPQAALDLARVDVGTYFVAALWYAQSVALRALDRNTETDDLQLRVGQLPGALIAKSVAYLRVAGHGDDAAQLLALGLSAQPDDPGLLYESLQLAHLRGERSSSLRVLCGMRERCQAVDPTLALQIALRNSDWPLADAIANEALDSLRNSRNEGDPWLLRAVRAGAALARDDDTPRAQLLSSAPSHVGALLILAQIERQIKSSPPLAGYRLRELTPNADALTDRPEVRV